MKLPNWFKISWWIVLILFTTIVLILRFNAIKNGESVPFDVFLFFIWVALMLVPIFTHIEIFGIKLKREIDNLKSQINLKFGDLKNEIKLTQTHNFTANIQGYGPPPPDDRISEIQQQLDILLKDRTKRHDTEIAIDVPTDNIDLFKIRYSIEKEINRIWFGRYEREVDEYTKRKIPMYRQIQDLQKFDIINGNLGGLLRELLSICNYGIHGEEITEKQIGFVKGSAEEIINYLKDVK